MAVSSLPEKPTALVPIWENIPLELREKAQWCMWRYVWKEEKQKWDKPPFQPNGTLASSTDPKTWRSFETVKRAYRTKQFDGVGFVFNGDYTGIDIDRSTDGDLISTVGSYTELSPSGKGVHIITRGAVSTDEKGGKRSADTEVYFKGRYFTVTGHTLSESPYPIIPTNGPVHALYDRLSTPTAPASVVSPRVVTTSVPDDQVFAIDMARVLELRARGNGFAKLWNGDHPSYDTLSDRAWALLKDIEKYVTRADKLAAIRVFKESPLYRIQPEKYERTLAKYDADSAHESVLQQIKPYQATRTWLHFDELAQLPQPSYLIDDIVTGEITVIYAPSASGKTFTAIHYSMLAAQEHKVMYIAAEDVNGVAMRARTWLDYHTYAHSGGFMVWPEELNLMTGETDTFLSEVAGLHLELIIIDTLALCMVGGDENSTKDMGIFIHNVKRIQHATGAAILILHHTDKKGIAERGNSALRGAAYTMLSLTKLNNVITVENVKAKNTALAPTKFFLLQQIDADHAVITTEKPRLEFGLGDDHMRVLKHVHIHGGSLTFTAIKEALKFDDKTLSRILSRLVSKELISQEAKRKPWVLTDTALSMLSVAD